MKKTLFLFLMLVLLPGCSPWFAAKTLSTEEIQAMKELMELENISGCIAGMADASYVVQAGIRIAVCAGKNMNLTVEEAKQLMHGINVNVVPKGN